MTMVMTVGKLPFALTACSDEDLWLYGTRKYVIVKFMDL